MQMYYWLVSGIITRMCGEDGVWRFVDASSCRRDNIVQIENMVWL